MNRCALYLNFFFLHWCRLSATYEAAMPTEESVMLYVLAITAVWRNYQIICTLRNLKTSCKWILALFKNLLVVKESEH